MNHLCFLKKLQEIRVELFSIEAFEERNQVDFESVMIVDHFIVPNIDIFEDFLYYFWKIYVLQYCVYFLDSCKEEFKWFLFRIKFSGSY